MKKKGFSNGGFSLVEVLVGIGVSGILALAISSMMSNQGKQMKVLSDKMAVMDFTNLLLSSWSDPTICTNQLTTPPKFIDTTLITPTSSPSMNLNFINGPGTQQIATVGKPVSPLSPQLLVESIQINRFAGSGDDFTAILQVNFETAGNRGIKPAMINLKIVTDPTSPANNKKVVGCGGAASTPAPSPTPTPTASALPLTSYPCPVPRNSSCTIKSANGMKFCALTRYELGFCGKCAQFNCTITGPDINGAFTLSGNSGDDGGRFCTMTCF